MTSTPRDNNRVPVAFAVSSVDGASVAVVALTDATHSMKVADDTTGSDLGPIDALRDENFETCLMAVSATDGVTPVVLYADATGALLIRST